MKTRLRLHTWNHKAGYLRCWRTGREYYAHRVIYEAHFGPIPEGYVIHHKNGVKTDNRPKNLACLSRSEHSRIHALERRNDLRNLALERVKTMPRDDKGRWTMAA